MEVAKKIGSIAVSVILWIIILLAALFAFTTLATRDTANVASLGGLTPMAVESDSMAPTFEKGDLIIVKKVDPSTLEEGDVITFHTIVDNQYVLNTHRIVDISQEQGMRSYVTKGDNNALSDPRTVADGDIVGKEVLVIAGLGKVMDFLSTSFGFLLVIVLPMLIFFIYQVYHLITISINLKRATQEEARLAQAQQILDSEETQKAAEPAVEEPAESAAAESVRTVEEEVEEAQRKRAEAEAMLAEAKRMKEEAEELARQARMQGEE